MRFSSFGVVCVAAALAGTAFVQPVLAQTPAGARSPAGDWKGDLPVPPVTYRLGIHIDETAPGAFKGTIGSHETGRWGTPLQNLAFADGVLSFAVPTSNANFKGTWDAAKGGYVGTYTIPQGPIALTLTPGVVPPLPTFTALEGRWEGVIEGLGFPVVLRIATTARGTGILMDFPEMRQSGLVGVALKVDGATVEFDAPNANIQFTGKLAGETLSGSWLQNGLDVPIKFERKSPIAGPALPPPAAAAR